MYKYRRLTIEELKILEESFIRFLAANSIAADDWNKIKTNDESKKNELIDQFSDVVIEKTLHNVKILEQRSRDRIVFYQFFDKHASLKGLEVPIGNPMDFREAFSLKDLYNLIENPKIQVDFLSGTKNYTKERLQEIFEILNQDSKIVEDETLFNSMLNLFNQFQ